MSGRRRAHWLLALLGAGVAVLAIEVAVRLATHAPLLAIGGPQSDRYVDIDPVVGRLPKADISVRLPKGFGITTGAHGTRRNGPSPPRAERPLVLAAGDSFAFGDEVDDQDSWPAVLERLSGGRVINAGVPGFGLDQAVLRAEQLAPVYAPDVIVVGFIPHDVERCEMSYWSGNPKPYFTVVGDALQYHPAPEPARAALDPLKRVLATSVAMDMLFPTFVHWSGPRELRVHDQGRRVACLLMPRLAALARSHRARAVVMAHPQEPDETAANVALAAGVLDCARAAGLEVLDLMPVFAALPPAQRQAMFQGHLSVVGNQFVAAHLAASLKGRGTTRHWDVGPDGPVRSGPE